MKTQVEHQQRFTRTLASTSILYNRLGASNYDKGIKLGKHVWLLNRRQHAINLPKIRGHLKYNPAIHEAFEMIPNTHMKHILGYKRQICMAWTSNKRNMHALMKMDTLLLAIKSHVNCLRKVRVTLTIP